MRICSCSRTRRSSARRSVNSKRRGKISRPASTKSRRGTSRPSPRSTTNICVKVPAVVGVRNLTKWVKNGEWALVDGYEGIVIVNPTESTLFRYGKIQERKKSIESRLLAANRQPALTLDGVAVTLMANIEKVDE